MSDFKKDREALNMLVRRLGYVQYRKILRVFQQYPPKSHESFAVFFSMLGIGGRPVTAFAQRYF